VCVQYRVGDRHRVSIIVPSPESLLPSRCGFNCYAVAAPPLSSCFCLLSRCYYYSYYYIQRSPTTATSPRVYYRYYYYKHIVVLNSRRQVRAADARLLVYSHNILYYAYDEILIIIILHCAFRYNFATGPSFPGCVIHWIVYCDTASFIVLSVDRGQKVQLGGGYFVENHGLWSIVVELYRRAC